MYTHQNPPTIIESNLDGWFRFDDGCVFERFATGEEQALLYKYLKEKSVKIPKTKNPPIEIW